LFITVFDYFKSTTHIVSNIEKPGTLTAPSSVEQILIEDNVDSEAYNRISIDAGVSIEQD